MIVPGIMGKIIKSFFKHCNKSLPDFKALFCAYRTNTPVERSLDRNPWPYYNNLSPIFPFNKMNAPFTQKMRISAHMKRLTNFTDISVFRACLILFFLALIPRIVCLWQMQHSPLANMLTLDAASYDRWARELAGGNWLGKDAFYAAPLYPYSLGILYRLFGRSFLLIRSIQIIIGAANCVLIFLVAKKALKNSSVAILAFTFALFFKLSVFYELFLVSETLASFFFLLLIYCALDMRQHPTNGRFAALGVIYGLSCLMRPHFLILLPLLIILIITGLPALPRYGRIKKCALFIYMFILCVLPVTVRNYVVAKDFVPLAAHDGINFYLGNGPFADGRHTNVPFLSSDFQGIKDSRRVASLAAKKELKASEASRYWYGKTFESIAKNPKRYCGLLLQKLRFFLSGLEMPDIFSYSFSYQFIPGLKILFVDFFLLIPLAIMGICLAVAPKKPAAVLFLFFISYTIGVILFVVSERLKMPLYPLFILFAAAGAILLFSPATSSTRKLTGLTIFIVCVLINFNKGFDYFYRVNHSASYAMVGDVLLKENETEKGFEYLRRAVALAPKTPDAHLLLGLWYLRANKLAEAEKSFITSIKLNPNLAFAHYYLATIYARQGMYAHADFHMRNYHLLKSR